MKALPTKAISIRPVWAYLIVNGFKDIENRSWNTRFRGEIYIHASQRNLRSDYDVALKTCQLASAMTGKTIELPAFEDLQTGGLVGTAKITGCAIKHPSPWFFGEYGFVLEDAKPMLFVPMNGKLGIFTIPQVS